MMQQQTLKKTYIFEGKGLHTGKVARMTLCPSAAGTGIRFCRTDIGESAIVRALAANVTNTTRSTTLSENGVDVVTVEHVLSAMAGLGVDNVLIKIDNVEVPILDGSAKPYTDAISEDGLEVLDAERKYITLDKEITVVDEAKGVKIVITPSDCPSFDSMIDFDSKVVGVQRAHWDESMDYVSEVGCCRTFVFFHELEALCKLNLIKGGDVDNAIVIVEHPVTDEQLDNMCSIFNVPKLERNENGYLSNVQLRFPNECARHKLLDLMGDMILCGGYLKASVKAEKSGHRMNTQAAKAVLAAVNNK